ncbi:MAG TPA: hypothetical protein VHC50_02890 [Puia sp.]|nr:hypothetical protein [Puia sp.]
MATSVGGSKSAWIGVGIVLVVVAVLYLVFELNNLNGKVDDIAERLNARPKVAPKDAPPIDIVPEGVKEASSAIVAPVQSEDSEPGSRFLDQNPPPTPITLEKACIQKPQDHSGESEVPQITRSESTPETSQWGHSEDFRQVTAFGKTFSLTLYQSRAVEKLWKAWNSHIPEMHQAAILEGIESCSKRLRDVFKSNMEAYRALIVPGERKGTFKLNFSVKAHLV